MIRRPDAIRLSRVFAAPLAGAFALLATVAARPVAAQEPAARSDSAQRAGLPLEIRRIVRAEVEQADELMLTSATKEVLPITKLDGKPVGDGRPGPVWRKVHAAYQQAKAL